MPRSALTVCPVVSGCPAETSRFRQAGNGDANLALAEAEQENARLGASWSWGRRTGHVDDAAERHSVGIVTGRQREDPWPVRGWRGCSPCSVCGPAKRDVSVCHHGIRTTVMIEASWPVSFVPAGAFGIVTQNESHGLRRGLNSFGPPGLSRPRET